MKPYVSCHDCFLQGSGSVTTTENTPILHFSLSFQSLSGFLLCYLLTHRPPCRKSAAPLQVRWWTHFENVNETLTNSCFSSVNNNIMFHLFLPEWRENIQLARSPSLLTNTPRSKMAKICCSVSTRSQSPVTADTGDVKECTLKYIG